MCLIPVHFCMMYRTIRQLDGCESLQLSPASATVKLPQSPPLSDGFARGDSLNIQNSTKNFEKHALILLPNPAASERPGRDSYGFTTIFPNIWLFSKYSCAARISLSGKTRSTTGFSRPAKTWPSTSCSSPIVPM